MQTTNSENRLKRSQPSSPSELPPSKKPRSSILKSGIKPTPRIKRPRTCKIAMEKAKAAVRLPSETILPPSLVKTSKRKRAPDNDNGDHDEKGVIPTKSKRLKIVANKSKHEKPSATVVPSPAVRRPKRRIKPVVKKRIHDPTPEPDYNIEVEPNLQLRDSVDPDAEFKTWYHSLSEEEQWQTYMPDSLWVEPEAEGTFVNNSFLPEIWESIENDELESEPKVGQGTPDDPFELE